jgi:hypothetical protein
MIAGHSVSDLWWTEWHCARFFMEYFDFCMSVYFLLYCIFIHSVMSVTLHNLSN